MKWGSLRSPWGDQVKGSWWKALFIVVGYFVIRFTAEGLIMGRAMSSMSGDASILYFEDPEVSAQLLQQIQWPNLVVGILIALLAMYVAYRVGFRFFHFDSLTGKNVMKIIGFYIFYFIIQGVWSSFISSNFPEYSTPQNQEVVVMMIENTNMIGSFISIVILAPIVEEFLLRGVIMKYLLPYTPLLGFIVSGVVFTLLHSPANWIDFSLYGLLSFALAGIYWYTRRLEYPILFHMFQNVISFIAIWFIGE